MTRFPTASLVILKQFFNLPNTVFLHPSENETRMDYDCHQGCHFFTDEELILSSLYRFAHGVNVTVLVDRFGGSIDKWIYGFKYFVRHVHPRIYPNIVGLENLSTYVRNFPSYASSIENTIKTDRTRYNNNNGAAIVYPGIEFDPGSFTIVGFFDCRNQKTLIPGSGPAGDFDGAPRNEGADIIQQAVYSGYKHIHGVKNLTVQLSNGLSFLFTPLSARRNDIDTLQASGLERVMEQIQAQEFDVINDGRVNRGPRFSLLGDGIFRFVAANGNSCIKSYHITPPGDELPQRQVAENHIFKSIRQHIEHTYGGLETTFALCADRKNFKLRGLNSIAIECLNLSHFLYNCYTADNGNSSSNRFGCLPPTLDEYLNIHHQ